MQNDRVVIENVRIVIENVLGTFRKLQCADNKGYNILMKRKAAPY